MTQKDLGAVLVVAAFITAVWFQSWHAVVVFALCLGNLCLERFSGRDQAPALDSRLKQLEDKVSALSLRGIAR